jgi:hypothetical protein
MHPIRSYKRHYLKVVIRGGHDHLVGQRYYYRRLGRRRRRSRRTQALDLGIDGLLVARTLPFKLAPLAPGRIPDSFALFTGQNHCRHPVCRYQHFGIEQGGKDNCTLANTIRVTDFAGAGKWNFSLRRLLMLIQYVPFLSDGECLLDRHPWVNMVK